MQTQHECGRSQGHCACLGQLQLLQRQSQVCSVCTTTRPCHEVQFKSQTVGAGFQTVCELFICQVYCQTLIPFLKTRGVFVSLLPGGNTCCYISLQGSGPDSSPQLLILALSLHVSKSSEEKVNYLWWAEHSLSAPTTSLFSFLHWSLIHSSVC